MCNVKEIKDTLIAIFNKLEDIDKKQEAMGSVQVKHEANLKEHMRRTELLEEEVDPISKHVEQVRGAGKLLVLLVAIVTIIASIVAIKGA